MSRPQIILNVKSALQRRGAPTATGTLFIAYAGATGPADVVEVNSTDDAIAKTVPAAVAAYVGDALNEGVPKVHIVRATAADPNAVTEVEWKAALGKLSAALGAGQVIIPGVTTPAAHNALLAHAESAGRTVLLDLAKDVTASVAATTATALAAAPGAPRAGVIAPWVTVPGPAGVAREVPGSVVAAGLVARGDAFVGHANHAPAGDQGRSAGVVDAGITVTKTYSDTELDTMHDAGVSVIRQINSKPTLMGWRSLSSDSRYRQLNTGRMTMQLSSGIRTIAEQFLFRQIDGKGLIYADLEAALRGYLAPLHAANALWGDTADEAYDVQVASINTPAMAAAGELHAAIAVKLTQHTEKVVINVVTSLASEGV